MARILILESHPDVRDLIAHVVEHVGHEPVLEQNGKPVDAIVVEPASPSLLAVAQRHVMERSATTAIVCVSIGPPSPASRALSPVAHVIKPFGLTELKQALAVAVSAAPAHS